MLPGSRLEATNPRVVGKALSSGPHGQPEEGLAGRWERFFLLDDAFASNGPAAVLTVQRSQGSSFGEVFVAGDGVWPSDEQLRRQLVYGAVSRARQAVGSWLKPTMIPGPSKSWAWLVQQLQPQRRPA